VKAQGVFSEELVNSNTTIYLGTDSQIIDWRMQSDKTDTPAYRNICYIVFNDIELEKLGNIIPNVTAEVVKNGTGIVQKLSNILTPSMSSSNIHYIDDEYVYSVGGYYDNNYTNVSYRFYKSPIQNNFNTLTEGTTDHRNIICNKGELTEYSCEINSILYHTPVFPMYTNNKDYSMMKLGIEGYQILESGMSCCYIDKHPFDYTNIPVENSDYNFFIYNKDVYYFNIDTNIIGKNGTEVSTRASQNWSSLNFSRIYVYDDKVYLITTRPTEIEITVYDTSLNEIKNNTTSRGVNSIKEAEYVGFAVVDNSGIHIFGYTGYDKVSLDLNHISYTNGLPRVDSVVDGAHFRKGILYLLKNTSYGSPPGSFNSIIERYNLNFLSNSGIYLSEILKELFLECGLLESDIDVTAGSTTLVNGYIVSKNMSPRTAIEPLLSAYEFSIVELNYQLVLRKQDQTSRSIIYDYDLVLVNGSKIEQNIKQEVDSIKRLTIKYANSISDYQTSVQSSMRMDTSSTNEIMIDMPLALSDTEAKKMSEKELYKSWSGRSSASFSLTFEYYFLIAGDVITLIIDEYAQDIKITKITITEDYKLECSGVLTSSSIFISNAIGSDTGDNGGEIAGLVGPTELEILDIPTLDNDYINIEGVYIACGGYTDNWNGCSVYSKSLMSDDLSLDVNLMSSSTIIGITKTKLLDGKTQVWDRVNTIDVQVNIDFTSYNKTEDDLLNGKNYILIGDEILQFKNITDISVLPTDNFFRLDTLLRGRRGTESKTTSHSIGERVVLLYSSLALGFIQKSIGNNDYYAAQTLGTTEFSEEESLLYTGNNLKPFSVWYLKIFNNSSNTLELDWQRRSRYISGYLKRLPIVDTPESYSILINNTVERFSSTSSFEYTNAMKADDGFGINDGFSFDISHIGLIYGESTKIIYGDFYPVYIKQLLPIAFWQFNETGSDIIAVEEINSYDGDIVSSPNLDYPSLIKDSNTTAVEFNLGASDYIRTPVLPISTSSEMSLSFLWENNELASPSLAKYIYHLRGTVGHRNMYFINNDLIMGNNDGASNTISYTFEDNKIYSIAAIYDIPNELGYIYANGVLVSSGNIGGATSGKLGSYDYFGRPADVGNYSAGILDEMSIFDRILTVEEITTIAINAGVF